MGKLIRVKINETKEEVFRVDSNELDEIILDGETVVINFTLKSEKEKKVFVFGDILQARECYNCIVNKLGIQCDN